MKLFEVLEEGVEFTPTEKVPDSHPDNKHGYYLSPHNMRMEDAECWVCDGSGKDRHGDEEYPCGMCKGTGKIKEQVSDGPTLQVSNSNAHSIVEDILGQEFDYAGYVDYEHLPELRRRLIKLKNVPAQRAGMTRAGSDERGPMRRQTDDQGVTHIGRGPRMVDMGRSESQVSRYADRLLDMVEYAMKHKIGIGWG